MTLLSSRGLFLSGEGVADIVGEKMWSDRCCDVRGKLASQRKPSRYFLSIICFSAMRGCRRQQLQQRVSARQVVIITRHSSPRGDRDTHRSTSRVSRIHPYSSLLLVTIPPFLDSLFFPPTCRNSHSSQKQHVEQQHARQKSSQGETQASTSLHSQPEAKKRRSSIPITVSSPHSPSFAY